MVSSVAARKERGNVNRVGGLVAGEFRTVSVFLLH
jgi:hypothetical protein